MKKAKSGSQGAITEAIHPATKYDLKSDETFLSQTSWLYLLGELIFL